MGSISDIFEGKSQNIFLFNFTCLFLLDESQVFLIFIDGSILDVVVFLDVGIESVFDLVFRSSRQVLADFRPLATDLREKLNDLPVFLIAPIILLNLGVEFVYETLSDLLPSLCPQHLRQQFPVFTDFFHQLLDGLIFLWRPNLAMGAKLGDSAVAVQALVFVTIVHEGSDECPFLGVLVIELDQVLVFFGSPSFDFTFFGVQVLLFDLEIDFDSIKALNGFAKLS